MTTFKTDESVSSDALRRVLLAAAEAAAHITLPLFRTSIAVDNKLGEGFDPVTEADKGAERAIRAVIEANFPDHEIMGEEYGLKQTGHAFRWIIDPIDGTRAFMSGLPVWGTLIGVTFQGRAIAGLMSQPFTGETFIAADNRAELLFQNRVVPLTTRLGGGLSAATMFTTTPELFKSQQAVQTFEALKQKARLTRYGCDCYAFALLASGHIDIAIETGLQSYDIAALIPIIEAAGGMVTTWEGNRAEAGGDVIATGNKALHEEALALIKDHIAS